MIACMHIVIHVHIVVKISIRPINMIRAYVVYTHSFNRKFLKRLSHLP